MSSSAIDAWVDRKKSSALSASVGARRVCLIVDEVDAMGAGDRGGIVALSKLIASVTVRGTGSCVDLMRRRGRAGSRYLYRQ